MSVQLLTLSFVTFLFTLFTFFFTLRNFRVDLIWRMVFLLGVFSRIVKVTDFAQVINFRKRAHGKIYPRKVDKNNIESTFLLFSSFSTQQQNKVYCPFFNTTPKIKSFCLLFFVAFVLAFVEHLDITVHKIIKQRRRRRAS